MAYIGLGIGYFENLDSGAAVAIENATKISIKGNTKQVGINSRRNDGSAGSLLYNVIRKEQDDFSLEIDAFPPLLLATQLMGTVEDVVEAAATVTAEVHYPTRGMGLLLNKANISAVMVSCANAIGGSGFLINGALAAGATVLTVDGTATSGTVAVGDVIALGSASGYKYRVAAVAITGTHPNKSGTITLTEGLKAAVADNATITHTAAYAVDVDFTIADAKTGFVQFTDKVASGDKAAGLGAVTVAYSYGGRTFKRILGGIKPSVPIKIVLNATNDANGSSGKLSVYRVRVTPSAEFDWMSENPQPIKLDGKLELVAGKTNTFDFEMDIVNT